MTEGTLFENVGDYKQKISIVSIIQIKEGDFCYSVKEPDDVCKLLTEFLENKDREYFVCLSLDSKGKVNNISTISIGSLWNAVVTPREVFKTAILSNAAQIIVAHNHPSGDITPSVEDKAVTESLHQAGKILGIEVLDHVVVGDGTYFSFKAHEMI
ncbi:dna repair protein radc [hydrocarbon metagenome]|uniref:Dna repair protein radc n=1 Tax=hydrocarbon metagenome TaxID=938273 RepID=A0A0W8E3E7_9ZZZZ